MATYFIKNDKDGYFYWTLRSDKNYKTVAMSSESYDSKQGVKDSIEWTQNNANTKDIIDET
jgi:uncharacterized protein YegP (UPF0339 family)